MEFKEITSLAEFLAMVGAATRGQSEPSPALVELMLNRASRDLAQEILKADMPLLVSANASGASTFMEFESENIAYNVTISARRKMPATNETTFAAPVKGDESRPDGWCDWCNRVHDKGDAGSPVRSESVSPWGSSGATVKATDDLKPNPEVWGGPKTGEPV